MDKEQILNWLNELTDEKPLIFQEYFYDDVRNFIVEEKVDTKRFQKIFQCKNKDEVKKWLDNTCGYIVMKLDIDLILENYFH